MRSRGLLLAALALCAAAAGTSSAAAPQPAPVLSIGGKASSSTTLTLTRPLSFNVTQNGRDEDSVRVTGGRTYVGFSVTDTGGRLKAAAFMPRGFTIDGRPLVVRVSDTRDQVTLAPGSYRVTFFGDAAGRVDLPLAGIGQRSRVLTGSRAASVVSEHVTPDNGLPGSAGVPVTRPLSEATLAASARPGHWTLLAAANVGPSPSDDHMWLCMRPQGAAKCSLLDHDSAFQSTAIGTGESTSVTGQYFAPGLLSTGSYDAGVGWRNIGTSNKPAAFVVTFKP